MLEVHYPNQRGKLARKDICLACVEDFTDTLYICISKGDLAQILLHYTMIFFQYKNHKKRLSAKFLNS
jgi:hypothetical protein